MNRNQSRLAKKNESNQNENASVLVRKTFDEAVTHHLAGRLEDAVASYKNGLAFHPNNAGAHSNLAIALKELGRLEEAEASCLRSLEIAPDFAGSYNNLGTILHDLGRLDEAAACYLRALKIEPSDAKANNTLGNIFRDLGSIAEAEECYRRALTIQPHYADAHYNLGVSLLQQGRADEAMLQFERVLVLDPNHAEAHVNLFQELYKIHCVAPERARMIALSLIETFPNDDVLRRGVGGIVDIIYSIEAERIYTTSLFDKFANDFDAVLNGLGYCAPEQLARAAGISAQPSADLDILDAGCGTGLCGAHLKPRARRLVGVDLSANMLAKAQLTGVYDDLIQDDIVSFLEGSAARFDLIFAADVLIYMGDVAPLARAAFMALRPGSICAVSAECLSDEDGASFILSPSGRYRHTAGYLQETFTMAGFTLAPLQTTSTRQEHGTPSLSWIVICRK